MGQANPTRVYERFSFSVTQSPIGVVSEALYSFEVCGSYHLGGSMNINLNEDILNHVIDNRPLICLTRDLLLTIKVHSAYLLEGGLIQTTDSGLGTTQYCRSNAI